MALQLTDLPMPLTMRPATALTDDELITFSQRNRPYRIERNREGELVVMSPVGGEGSGNEFYVLQELSFWIKQSGTGKGFSSAAGFTLPDGSCLSPDAAFISNSRWNALTPAQRKTFPPLCPDFLIEVRSESDTRVALEAKMQLWIENGAQLAWLIDPLEATVTIYQPQQPTETLERPEAVIGHGPVSGLRFDCTALWPTL